MRQRKSSLTVTVLSVVLMAFILCLVGITEVFGEVERKSGEKPVADEMIGSSGITWIPKVNYTQLELRVARPDGTVFQRTFESGTTPYLDLSSIFGSNFADGQYTYELRMIPGRQMKSRVNMEKAGLEQSSPDSESLAQTGHFIVQGGAIISGSSEEISRVMDVIHADDVIITGSLCVGFDCLTDGSENFGFDTIKLKENNLRIFFDDTSTTAGFPANDWRIIANDSASGGGNYLSIEDSTNSRTPFKIEANARTSALYVNSSGKVGLGTSTPVLNLHIQYGDTPSIRLDQDTSFGWTAQVWDIAGNESNFFVRDTTGGSKLPFRIQPGTPTNTITMKSTGYVGIGTWSPAYPLEVETTGQNAVVLCERTSGASCYMNATDAYGNFGTTTSHPVRLVASGIWQMAVDSNCDITMRDGGGYNGTWNPSSSRELKENIQDLNTDEAIEALTGLNPVKYNYKEQKEEPRVGFIAEDVPELVAMNGRKTLGTVDILAVLTKVVKEQQKSLQEQQEILREQQETISQLKEKIMELEKK